MLNSDRTPTKPPAAATLTLETPLVRKKSWIIGLACSRIPIPAVTLQKSTIHNSQNDRDRIALAAAALAVVAKGFAATVEGSQPAGRHPVAGTRMLATPNIMIRK